MSASNRASDLRILQGSASIYRPLVVINEAERLAAEGLAVNSLVLQDDTEELFEVTVADPLTYEQATEPDYQPYESADADGIASGMVGKTSGAIAIALDEFVPNESGYYVWDGVATITPIESPDTGLPIEVADETARLALTGLDLFAVVHQMDNGSLWSLTSPGFESEPGSWDQLKNPTEANALVPDDAPILPAQAFVDNIYAVFNNAGASSPVDMSAKGLTHFDDELAYILFNTQGEGSCSLDLSSNSLPVADVDAILDSADGIGFNGIVLHLEGQTPPAPPTAPTHVDGVWTITITGTPVGSITLTDFANNTVNPTFGTDIDVTSGDAAIIADNLNTFINDAGYWSSSIVGNVVTVTVTSDSLLPLTPATDSATNLTIADTAAGVAAIRPSIRGIQSHGGTVTTD